MEKEKKRLAFRLLMLPFLLYSFYLLEFPPELVAVLGAFFASFILLRGKIWRSAEILIEKYFPFTKNWHPWAQKALLFLFFYIIFLLLKQVVFFFLGFAGIDLDAALLGSLNNSLEEAKNAF